jgi:hypothetical protein
MGVVQTPIPLRAVGDGTTALPEGIHELSRPPLPPHQHDLPGNSQGPAGVAPLDGLPLILGHLHSFPDESLADRDG